METFYALLAPHKGQCHWDLMFSLICAWIKGWVNNRDADDLRRHSAHYGMKCNAREYITQDDTYLCYKYLCDQSGKAIICTQRTTKCIEPLTPEIYFYMSDSLVRPLLTYGSEVWGVSKSFLQELDRVFLRYMRCHGVLRVKATTSNLAVYGECQLPPPPPPVCHAMYHYWASSMGCAICLIHYW